VFYTAAEEEYSEARKGKRVHKNKKKEYHEKQLDCACRITGASRDGSVSHVA
jgi:hypothetical protein